MEYTDFIATTNIDLNNLWQDILEEIAKNISALSFDVWIKSLEVIDLKSNTIVLATSTKSTQSMLIKSYKTKIVTACNKVYSAITNVESIVKALKRIQNKYPKVSHESIYKLSPEFVANQLLQDI